MTTAVATVPGVDPTAGAVFETARGQALQALTEVVGRVQACAALGVSRATWYRHHRRSPAPVKTKRPRQRHPRALSQAEEAQVLAVLRSPEFVDMAPAEIYAVLLDRAPTCARRRRCTASCAGTARSANAAARPLIHRARNPN
ncbi:helix-turn-helix domain-containing protein [Streptomyces sp. NBC_01262]